MANESENNLDFFRLSYGTFKEIETLEEQRAINAGGVQMICISKPSLKKEIPIEKQEETPKG